ncbi:protein-L-isoaspartate O-methyltransferase [Candidatus Falkowbacteria bacterium CG10_big_fil_rev_8_21_14_0_10_44_15]|uniref:Protein-L-isoaspartate O-methyltransferase n=1 Tax=Candidatus Falkowbacteria bacterium CG10_big_fil_rev_8_21_14_0_10_44_15 TaxID=1974569 RepID=A0A2H0UZG9_9BACT|nr:MAG: protein-L-isoaspartate O-methyltransferase [Candidatus Falkowbacteria bacterium CG10_big_fil_rev_8_21_14_0_10_44_15]
MFQIGLTKYLIDLDVLKSPHIINAFQSIDRADFVPRKYLNEAYGDYPLPLGYGQTISQPTTVAFMLEKLQPQAGEKILDVGSGSGWTTALLAQIVGPAGKVCGVEIVPELAEFGRKNLANYELNWAEIKLVTGELGCPPLAPFDKILVSAAAEEPPGKLLTQLKIGGRLIIPIQNSIWQIDKAAAGKFRQQEFPGFVFVPLV